MLGEAIVTERHFEQMPRALAERNLNVRLEKLKAEIVALPLAEKLRLAAGFLDRGERGFAKSIVRLAAKEAEELP